MRNINRSAAAVVLILALAMPAQAAASRSSRSRGGYLHAVKRFIIRVVSRISPPGGVSAPTSEEPGPTDPMTTTTEGTPLP